MLTATISFRQCLGCDDNPNIRKISLYINFLRYIHIYITACCKDFPLAPVSRPTFSSALSDFENIFVSTKALISAIFTRFFFSLPRRPVVELLSSDFPMGLNGES